jgi:uncharacterized protein DUF3489
LQRFQILLDVPPNQSHECRDAVTTAKGRITLMTTQEQDQPTVASEPAESGKARAATRKPRAATTKAKSTRKPRRGKKAPKRRPKAKAATPGQGSKTAHVIALLEKSKGATLAELMKATGWQAHSVRGFLSGTLRKKMGLRIESAKSGDGGRVYSISR